MARRPSSTWPVLSLLLLSVTSTAHGAERPEVVHGLVEAGDLDKAQKRCEKWQARFPNADPELRDACARAYWSVAAEADTVQAWSSYRATWSGTRGEAPALEREARAALIALGPAAPEDALLRMARRYADTAAAGTAREMALKVALKGVRDPGDALRVIREYPDSPETTALLERYLGDLVQVEVTGAQIDAHLVSPLRVPDGSQLIARWAATHPDGTVVDWAEEAAGHLARAGVSEAVIARVKADDGRGFPLCHDPTAGPGWRVGVEVQLGDGRAWKDVPWSADCGPDQWPVFLTRTRGRVDSLSLRPGHLMRFPTERAEDGTPWTAPDGSTTELYLPLEPGSPLTVATAQVIGQQAGELFLVHPVAGGAPWLTSMRPPRDTVELDHLGTEVAGTRLAPDRPGLGPLELPPGWTVGQVEDGWRVTGPFDGEWRLPPGELRALSPLVQWATGLHQRNPELSTTGAPPLPPVSDSAWSRSGTSLQARAPAGGEDLPLEPASQEDLEEVLRMLSDAGVPVTPVRGWRLDLDADSQIETVLEAERGGVAMRVVADTYRSGARRLFLLDAMPRAELSALRATPFAFRLDGHTYVAWTWGTRTPFLEALHLDDRGLIREYSTR